jgi:HEAT repeat protein
LLKAAELHGATHQAAMEFQVATSKRLPQLRVGRSSIALLSARLLTELVGRPVFQTCRGRMRWGHVTMLATLIFAASPASAYIVGPPVALEEVARTADLVCKATVIADRSVIDGWFEPISGFEVRETQLRVVSIVKGTASNVIRFRHYAPSSEFSWPAPPSYKFVTGRTYLLLATQVADDMYRQLGKAPTRMDRSVLLAADGKPHRGTTLTEAAWAELLALLKSPAEDDVAGAIHRLDVMSGGAAWDEFGLKDFERSQALAAIEPLLGTKRVAVVTAAITVFGRDSPYFDDRDAPFWLVGIGKGHIPGLGARKRLASTLADIGTKEVLQVATDGMTPELRALAIRALGRSLHATPATMVAVWLRDPSILVRRAAVLASADLPDREPIVTASTDFSPDIRCTAALAVGFAQDPRLLPLLNNLLRDPAAKVRGDAAVSLVSFPLDQAPPMMKANLASDFRSVFVNALAQGDPQSYLASLAEIIEQQPQPAPPWWGGAFPAGDSWRILFDFVKSRAGGMRPNKTADLTIRLDIAREPPVGLVQHQRQLNQVITQYCLGVIPVCVAFTTAQAQCGIC